MLKNIIFLFLLFTFSSCIKDVDYKLDFEGSKMVIWGGGVSGQQLKVSVTKTIPPLTEVNDPNTLFINDALIEVFENGKLADTMYNIGKGKYLSNLIAQEGNYYKIAVKAKGLPNIISGVDTVSIPAKIIDTEIIDILYDPDSLVSPEIILDLGITAKKSLKYPYNILILLIFSNGESYEKNLSLDADIDFVECQSCFDILDNPCIKKIGNDIYKINTKLTLYDPGFKASDIDSIRFVLATFSSLSTKLCQNAINLEEYYGNPLPFVSNPAVNFSNIEGGYGLFMLTSADSITLKIK